MTGLNLENNGCHLHPDCFTCPLPQCIFENSEDSRRMRGPMMKTLQKLEQVRQLKKDGYTSDAMANIMGTSRRTVYRLLQQLEGEGQ